MYEQQNNGEKNLDDVERAGIEPFLFCQKTHPTNVNTEDFQMRSKAAVKDAKNKIISSQFIKN